MKVKVIQSQLMKDWELLHSIPEVGFSEVQTSAYIRSRLEILGYEVHSIAGTGLLAVLRGESPGKHVGLRADMDALRFQNEDGSSTVLHACGHDAHCAMVLSAGAMAVEAGLKKGTLYLLFQPGEETICGAHKVIKDGGLPCLDALLGIHLRPENELPLGCATAQLLHQATVPTTITFYGKAAHAARPHLGINALTAAAEMIRRINAMQVETEYSWSAKATNCTCYENSHNVIPERCTVMVDLRAQSNDLACFLVKKVREFAEESAEAVGCRLEISNKFGYAAEYDPELIRICETAITETYGSAYGPLPTLGSEDFHAYHQEYGIPVAYMGLGANLTPGLHDRNMTFDHSCMVDGTKILFRCITQLLDFENPNC